MVSEGYPTMFGPPYTTMEQNTGALIVYTVSSGVWQPGS